MKNRSFQNIFCKKFVFICLCFNCFLFSCGDAEKSTIDRGHRWLARGEYKYAIQAYSKAFEKNRNNPDILFFRGVAKTKNGDINGAIDDFSLAIQLNPKHIGAYINRGTLFSKKNNFDKALKDLNKAIELNPKEYQAYLLRAEVWFYKKDYDKSIQDCSIVIVNNPQMAIAYRDRADAFYWKRNYREAIKDYSKAIELDQKDSYALNNIAWILATCEDEKIRDGKKALFYSKKAVDINPSSANLGTLAAAYAQNNNFKEAVEIMKNILSAEKEKDERNVRYLGLFLNHQPIREKPGE